MSLIQSMPTYPDNTLIIVVDDDEAVREALGELMASIGLKTVIFASISELATEPIPDAPGCLIFDVFADDQNDLPQCGLAARKHFDMMNGADPEMIFAVLSTARSEILFKPFPSHQLLGAVGRAIAVDAALRTRSPVNAIRWTVG